MSGEGREDAGKRRALSPAGTRVIASAARLIVAANEAAALDFMDVFREKMVRADGGCRGWSEVLPPDCAGPKLETCRVLERETAKEKKSKKAS